MVHAHSGIASSDAVALSRDQSRQSAASTGSAPPPDDKGGDPDHPGPPSRSDPHSPDGPSPSPAPDPDSLCCGVSPAGLLQEARAWRPQLPWSVLLVYCALNFTQELPVTAVSYLLVNELNLSPAQQTVFYATIMLPWWAKPGYALVSDALPILSLRRRPYLLLCSVGVALSYLAIAFLAVTPSTMLAYNIAASVFVCFCEVVADSIAIEITNRGIKRSAAMQLPASIQSECMAARTLGSLFAASASLALLTFWPPRVVIAVTAAGPIATGAMAFFVPDEPVPAGYFAATAKSFLRTDLMIEKLGKYVSAARELAFPLFFVFLCNLVPTYDDAYEYYLFDHNAYGGFTPNQLAAFQLAGTGGALIGTLLYWRFCSRTNIRRVYVIGIFVGALASGTEIVFALGLTDRMHISPAWYVALDSVLVSVCSRVALMPGVVLAAMSCPPGIEAVMLGLFSTAQQVAIYISAYGTAALTDGLGVREGEYSHLWLLMAICVGSTFLPLVLLRWLPEKPFVARSELAFAAADPTQVEPSESEISVALLHTDEAGRESPGPSPSPSYGSLSSSPTLLSSPPVPSPTE